MALAQPDLTPQQVAGKLQCSYAFVLDEIGAGRLRAYRLGAGARAPYRISCDALENYLREQAA